ncbi:hypothetical protein FRB98_002121 [Tulasnella sp. 332]|nr:hypothetical protein FRB98_002121 [Tulasnella sp. 332]
MFGPFHGPFPEGKYLIQWSSNIDSAVFNLTSVVSNAPVNMVVPESGNDKQVWEFEYAVKGYRIKNVATDTYLTYSPWAVPNQILGNDGYIVCADESPVEWSLVQTGRTFAGRYFRLRVVGGLNLQPNDDLALYWNNEGSNNFLCLTGLTSGSTLIIRAVGTTEAVISPVTPLIPANNKKCVIRSAFYPEVALDLFKGGSTTGNLVLINNVSGEDSQSWTLIKGGRGFRLKNVMAQDSLGFAPVTGTPVPDKKSVVCQDDKAVEWLFVQSTYGTEIRLASDPKLAIALWNCDVGKTGWIYLNDQGASGNSDTNQQWVFAEPTSNTTQSRSMRALTYAEVKGSEHAGGEDIATTPSEDVTEA